MKIKHQTITIFYQKNTFQTAEELITAIDEYIYYNNKRIKIKLKELTPVQYRNQPSKVA